MSTKYSRQAGVNMHGSVWVFCTTHKLLEEEKYISTHAAGAAVVSRPLQQTSLVQPDRLICLCHCTLERQDLSCMHLAHHDLESVFVVMMMMILSLLLSLLLLFLRLSLLSSPSLHSVVVFRYLMSHIECVKLLWCSMCNGGRHRHGIPAV